MSNKTQAKATDAKSGKTNDLDLLATPEQIAAYGRKPVRVMLRVNADGVVVAMRAASQSRAIPPRRYTGYAFVWMDEDSLFAIQDKEAIEQPRDYFALRCAVHGSQAGGDLYKTMDEARAGQQKHSNEHPLQGAGVNVAIIGVTVFDHKDDEEYAVHPITGRRL